MRRPNHLVRRQTRGAAFGEPATLRRFAPGHVERGSFITGASTDRPIQVASVPISGELEETLPEGIRVEDAREFLTADIDIQVVKRNPPTASDRIIWKGDVYRVVRIEPHGRRARVLGVRGDRAMAAEMADDNP